MSRKRTNERTNDRQDRDHRRRRRSRYGKVWHRLWERLRGRVGAAAGQLTAETEEREPIDFSAPSIPYYANLADRFGLARIVLYMILLVFVVVTIVSNRHLITYANLYYLARDINAATITAQSEASYLSYPVSSRSPDVAVYRGGVVVVGGEELTVLSGTGKQTLSERVTYAQPCVRAADKYFLAFGRGETGFAVYNAFGRMYAEATDHPIYDACMGDSGTFAVLTRSETYTSEVILYDDDMNKLAVCHLGGYVTSLVTNLTGDVTAMLSAEASDGVFETKLMLARTGDRVITKEVTFADTLVGCAAFLSDDRLVLVCSDRLLFLNAEGDVLKEVDMSDRDMSLCAFGNGRVAVLSTPAADLTERSLTVYDRVGRESFSVALPAMSGITEIAFNGSDVYVRASETLLRVAKDGKEMSSLALREQVLCLLDAGEDTPLLCSQAHAYHPSVEDFMSLS